MLRIGWACMALLSVSCLAYGCMWVPAAIAVGVVAAVEGGDGSPRPPEVRAELVSAEASSEALQGCHDPECLKDILPGADPIPPGEVSWRAGKVAVRVTLPGAKPGFVLVRPAK